MAFRVYGIVIFLKCQNSTLHCVCLCLMLGRDKKTSRPRQSNCALICFCSVTKKLFSGGCYHSQLISAAATLLGGQPMTKQGSVATRGGHDTNILWDSPLSSLLWEQNFQEGLGRGQWSVWSREETLCWPLVMIGTSHVVSPSEPRGRGD